MRGKAPPEQGPKVIQRHSPRLLDRTSVLFKSSWIAWREEKVKAIITGGTNAEKWDKQKSKFLFLLMGQLTLSSLPFSPSVELPVHRLGKLCPVLNISLVSNRQEPQLSDSCLAHTHTQRSRLGRSSGCETQLIPMWVRKPGHLATAPHGGHRNGGTFWGWVSGVAVVLDPGSGSAFSAVLTKRKNGQAHASLSVHRERKYQFPALCYW